MKKTISTILIILLTVTLGCGKKTASTTTSQGFNYAGYPLTFIELGSVNCVPCRMMQPVMAQVETNYSDIVRVLFYDVWTPQGEPLGRLFHVTAIPTQIFVTPEGKEVFRHVGYFPYEEVEKVIHTFVTQGR